MYLCCWRRSLAATPVIVRDTVTGRWRRATLRLRAAGARRNAPALALWVVVSSGCLLPRQYVVPLEPGADPYADSPASCLLRSPVDPSIDLKAPSPSFYVNELRLGYARGDAIFLSRPLCEIYGSALCRFVEAHEQAHHYTNTVGQQSMCAETVADCWAAVHSDAEALDAALEFFRSRQGRGGYHGDPSARASIIFHCARRWRRDEPFGAAPSMAKNQ